MGGIILLFTYRIPAGGYVSLALYNAMGQRVALLVDENQPAVVHTLPFDASVLPSGFYTCCLEANGTRLTKKVVVAR